MDVIIRNAETGEAETLTELSFASKAIWNYPAEYFEVWKDELTITPDYIAQNKVFVAENAAFGCGQRIIGYLSITKVENDFFAGKVFVSQGYWLEHLFIHPDFIGKGIGRKLVNFAKDFCCKNGIRCLRIFSDPHAGGFYEKIGAGFIGESPSSIEGRNVQTYELWL